MSSAVSLAPSPRLAPRPRKRMTRRDPADGKATRNAFVEAPLMDLRIGGSLPQCQILYANWQNHLSQALCCVGVSGTASRGASDFSYCGDFCGTSKCRMLSPMDLPRHPGRV